MKLGAHIICCSKEISTTELLLPLSYLRRRKDGHYPEASVLTPLSTAKEDPLITSVRYQPASSSESPTPSTSDSRTLPSVTHHHRFKVPPFPLSVFFLFYYLFLFSFIFVFTLYLRVSPFFMPLTQCRRYYLQFIANCRRKTILLHNNDIFYSEIIKTRNVFIKIQLKRNKLKTNLLTFSSPKNSNIKTSDVRLTRFTFTYFYC